MVQVLLTGMSGTGKSTVLAELARRGHRVVDTDDPGWSEELPAPEGGVEQLWVEPRVASLLAAHDDVVVSGCVRNQGRFAFDVVVLLSAPAEVLLSRLAARTTNRFGRSDADRARVLADLEAVEPLLRASAAVEVRTDRPLLQVVADVEGGVERAVRAGGRRPPP